MVHACQGVSDGAARFSAALNALLSLMALTESSAAGNQLRQTCLTTTTFAKATNTAVLNLDRLISLVSPLAGRFFLVPQHAIKLIHELHQPIRVHFFTRLFGKVFPITR
jgi:hypothetical protein